MRGEKRMITRSRVGISLVILSAVANAQDSRRSKIDVDSYVITAEINPRTQSLSASAQVKFTALDNNTSIVTFELNNSLNVSRVTDASGRQIQATRGQQDNTLRLILPEAAKKGDVLTYTLSYDGHFTGSEESPVYGIKFASIQTDYSFLMYPARWFPINEYTADRYTAELHITVPAGYKVLSSGIDTNEPAGDKVTYHFKFSNPSFPGSLAVVKGDPVRAGGQVVYFREKSLAMASSYGEEAGKILADLTGRFGIAPYSSLTIVETESGAPNGYAAPGMLFLSTKAIAAQVNPRLLANQIARQWWGILFSAASRNHLWITNGMARYAEILYIEQTAGPAAMESEVRDTYVEALTVTEAPLIQAGRLEDYSPEFIAATSGKGAAVIHMLRYVMGEEKFALLLKAVPDQYQWKSLSTEDFKNTASKIAGTDLGYFFIQWIESTGAPEFKLEYTVYRTQKGFRIMGKIAQDLDTFRMPVDLKIETEGNPEEKRVEVAGTSSEFLVETFGKPKKVEIDVNNRVLRYSNQMRVAVAIRRGEQFAEIGEFGEALKEYQKALDVNKNSSLAHYRVGEAFFLQNNYQAGANEFREALNGDLEPKWTEVWSHLNLGMIFDITGQRERAVNEYNLAIRTKDNTQGAQEEAAKYLREPFKRKKPMN
jgi:aminopeptidase N